KRVLFRSCRHNPRNRIGAGLAAESSAVGVGVGPRPSRSAKESMLVRVDHWALTTAVAFLTAGPVAGVSDAWVTARVKMSLMASPQVGGIPIDVDTNQGLVTLNGKVKTRVETSAAERTAHNRSGVA